MPLLVLGKNYTYDRLYQQVAAAPDGISARLPDGPTRVIASTSDIGTAGDLERHARDPVSLALPTAHVVSPARNPIGHNITGTT